MEMLVSIQRPMSVTSQDDMIGIHAVYYMEYAQDFLFG